MRWRLFEQKGDDLYTLFHGVNGSRKIEEGVWYEADDRLVRDGTSKTWYPGGFHVFWGTNPEGLIEYIDRFTKPRHLVLVKVEIAGKYRFKPTNKKILLADRMRVPFGAERITVKEAV